MEENKRKALEKRKLLKNQSQPPPKASTQNGNVSSFYGKPKDKSIEKPRIPTTSNPFSGPSTPMSPGHQRIIGKCAIISRDRFVIDIKYNIEVINLFKQSKSGSYNAKDRNWNFLIQEHDDLIFKLRPLQKTANVQIEALPRWVLDTFKHFKSKIIKPEEVDLEAVEPTILNALMPFQRFVHFLTY